MSDDLSRQIRTRLAGLEAAGVEWLPRVDAPIVVEPAAQAPVETRTLPDSPDRRLHELTVLAERVRGCTLAAQSWRATRTRP